VLLIASYLCFGNWFGLVFEVQRWIVYPDRDHKTGALGSDFWFYFERTS
jgi:hypothetical protein